MPREVRFDKSEILVESNTLRTPTSTVKGKETRLGSILKKQRGVLRVREEMTTSTPL